jgi:hypothetical protein
MRRRAVGGLEPAVDRCPSGPAIAAVRAKRPEIGRGGVPLVRSRTMSGHKGGFMKRAPRVIRPLRHFPRQRLPHLLPLRSLRRLPRLLPLRFLTRLPRLLPLRSLRMSSPSNSDGKENAALHKVGKHFRFVHDAFEKLQDVLELGAKTDSETDPKTLVPGWVPAPLSCPKLTRLSVAARDRVLFDLYQKLKAIHPGLDDDVERLASTGAVAREVWSLRGCRR